MNQLKVKFAGFDCIAEFDRYTSTGNVAIQLIDANDGEPITTATVNIDHLEDGYCAVKNWSENDRMEEALLSAGIIEPGVCDIKLSGFVKAPVYRLSAAALKAIAEKGVCHG